MLVHFNPQLPIIVANDTRDYGSGAVLVNNFRHGGQKAVCNVSHTLTKDE